MCNKLSICFRSEILKSHCGPFGNVAGRVVDLEEERLQ